MAEKLFKKTFYKFFKQIYNEEMLEVSVALRKLSSVHFQGDSMKKVLALIAAVAVSVIGAFAFDVATVRGTWYDEKYDADWTFKADGTIVLTYHSTGAHVYTFTDDNVENFRVSLQDTGDEAGVSIQFTGKNTHRKYKFVKPANLEADLNMTINPDWTNWDYITTIKFQKAAAE